MKANEMSASRVADCFLAAIQGYSQNPYEIVSVDDDPDISTNGECRISLNGDSNFVSDGIAIEDAAKSLINVLVKSKATKFGVKVGSIEFKDVNEKGEKPILCRFFYYFA